MTLVTILIFFSAMIMTLLAIPPVIKIAKLKHLFDEPSEDRKIHIYKTPNLGGIGIFISILLTICLLIPFNLIPHINYIIASTVILFVLGLKDDLVGLSPLIKFIAQIVAAGIICYFADIRLTSLYGFFGIGNISVPLSILVSILVILLVVNAFNLIDGIDCLSGIIGLIVSISFTFAFYALHQQGLMYLSICIGGSLTGFLYFNKSPAKIFMGDTGSLMLGFLIAILSIKFVEFNKFNAITNAQPVFRSAPAMVCGLLIVPIFDTLRVFTLRLIKGVSPFNADRNHIHHRLIDFKLSHIQSSGVLAAINLFFIAIVYLLQDIGTLELFMFISILALTLNVISWHFANLHTRTELNSGNEEEVMELDNVVSLAKKNIFSHEFKKKFNHPL